MDERRLNDEEPHYNCTSGGCSSPDEGECWANPSPAENTASEEGVYLGKDADANCKRCGGSGHHKTTFMLGLDKQEVNVRCECTIAGLNYK